MHDFRAARMGRGGRARIAEIGGAEVGVVLTGVGREQPAMPAAVFAANPATIRSLLHLVGLCRRAAARICDWAGAGGADWS